MQIIIFSYFSQKSEGSKGSLNFQTHEMCMEVKLLMVTLAVFGRFAFIHNHPLEGGS